MKEPNGKVKRSIAVAHLNVVVLQDRAPASNNNLISVTLNAQRILVQQPPDFKDKNHYGLERGDSGHRT